MQTQAEFSPCGKYRYSFYQQWDASKPNVMFIGLNPTAMDDKQSNPTLKRCINYAQDWGFGGLYVTNLFALLALTPKDLKQAKNPIGQHNDEWLKTAANNCDLIIAAWGNDGDYLNRGQQLVTLIPNLKCLKINQSGQPAHPLYQPKTAMPIDYKNAKI